MPDQRKPIEIQFPFRGIDNTMAYRRQPKGTTPFAVNVRPFDGIEHRLRGGQRDGHANYTGGHAVNGTNPIQAISQVTSAFNLSTVIAGPILFSDTFTQADDVLDTTHWYLFRGAVLNADPWPVVLNTIATGPRVKDNAINNEDQVTGNKRWAAMVKDAITPGSQYALRFNYVHNAGGQMGFIGFIIRAGDPSGATLAVNSYGMVGIGGITNVDPGIARIRILATGVTVDFNTDLGYPADFWTTEHLVEVRVNGNAISLWVDNIKVLEERTSALSGNTYTGFFFGEIDNNTDWDMDNFVVHAGLAPASYRDTKLVAVSGGRVYWINPDVSGGASEAITAAIEFQTAGRVALQEAYAKMYGCDGIPSNYRVYDPATHSVGGWVATAGTLPVESDDAATSYTIDGVNQGTKTFTISGDGDLSAILAVDTYFVIAGSTGNDGTYRITAIAYGAPNFNATVAETIPDANVDGTITGMDVGCRLMALYRGRVVLAGMHTDPHNWFMSAVGDPLDWDYSPTTTSATMAVAGVNTDAGKLGDIITALIPYSDDLMVMGGDHTTWVMRGDPADGGVIDNISYQTGIAGPDAYTWDPDGNLYFFGNNSLWKIGAGVTSIEDISRKRMHSAFSDINYATHRVRLLWDSISQGVHIYVTPLTQASEAGYHFYWCQRTDSLWVDEFPLGFGPTAVWTYDADDPYDRAMLVGGFDSMIRYISESSTDDSTAITSLVIFTPIVGAGDLANIRLSELTVNLATDSDPVVLGIYANESVQAMLDDVVTPIVARTLRAGRNSSIRQRVNGNALTIILANASTESYTWALESMVGLIKLSGKTRKGRL